jgi:copper resistance protein B
MIRIAPGAGLAAALVASVASAQMMPGMDMSGAHAHHAPPATPAPAARKPAAPRAAASRPVAKAGRTGRTAPHAGHDTPAAAPAGPAAEPDSAAAPHDRGHADHAAMAGMAAPDAAPTPVGTALPAGDAPAPAPPRDHYADRAWGAAAMAASRAALARDHGGGTFTRILVNIAEVQARAGRDGYRWDGEAWLGGDINRLTVKSEGEGAFGSRTDQAEGQVLYSRAVDAYWNLQAGIRHDLRPDPSRTYATIGVEGLAPYWFQIEGALFLSDQGDLLGRFEASHDMRLTQRLILQPRAELNLAAQEMPAQRIGSGLSTAELGLRLRYEMRREFAPYVGLSYERKTGDTARLARQAGDGVRATSLVIGVRTWF